MCNLYSLMKDRAQVAALLRAIYRPNPGTNQPPMPGIFPDYSAPIVINGPVRRKPSRTSACVHR